MMYSTDIKKANKTESSTFIQAKLRIGRSNDKYEQEADRIADKVIKGSNQIDYNHKGPILQKQCADCEEEELQMKSISNDITPLIQTKSNLREQVASTTITRDIQSSIGQGREMESNTKSIMEHQFGRDFSEVKIHSNSKSVALSQEINARAFTVGNDIFFNRGEYQPHSKKGKHLLAHELTHTLQQSYGSDYLQKKENKLPKISGNATTYLRYKVEAGDSLSKISKRFDVKGGSETIYQFTSKTYKLNNINDIKTGQWIAIPYKTIRNTAEARDYRPEKKSYKKEQTFFPLMRRAEIEVSPNPIVLKPLNQPMQNALVIDSEYIINQKLIERDENMITAIWASAGLTAEQGLTTNLLDPVSVIIGQPIAFTESDNDRVWKKNTIKIYLKLTNKSFEEVKEEFKLKRKILEASPQKAKPQQKVYFNFDSIAFNKNLTTGKYWTFVLKQIQKYLIDAKDYGSQVSRFKDIKPEIKILAYSSFRGEEAYNIELSKKRANHMKSLIIENIKKNKGLKNFDYSVKAIGMGIDDTLIIY